MSESNPSAVAIEHDHRPSHGECPPSGWDYVFAFSAPSSLSDVPSRKRARHDTARNYLLSRLVSASFVYSQVWLPATGLYLVRVAMPEAVLMEKAERIGLRLRLGREFGGGYMSFSRKHEHQFENHLSRLTGRPYFTPSQRLRITIATLNSRDDWGVDMNINRLFRKGVLRKAFALHAPPERDELLKDVVFSREVWPWRSSRDYLDKLNDYFGPRIAIYLAWLMFYTRLLTGFALVSLAVYICLELLNPRFEALADACRIFYGISISFWSTYWLEHWQRRNAVLNSQWGLTDDLDYSVNEIRQDFRGIEIPGFYSQGGFVHLADLAARHTAPSSSSSENDDEQGDDAVVPEAAAEEGRQPGSSEVPTAETPLLRRFLSNHFREDDESVNWSGYSHSMDSDRSDALRIPVINSLSSAAATARTENPVESIGGHDYVVIGGETDADFRVLAPVTGASFDDVPRFPFFDQSVHRRRVLVGSLVTALFIVVVASLQFLITYFKRSFSVALGYHRSEAWPAGVATAILIVASDSMWRFVSTEIVKWENHHANQSFENSLIRKRFAFQFVSNYFSLFYIAFVKPFTPWDACVLDSIGETNCLHELSTTLVTIVATKATVEQALELGIPYLVYMMNSGMRKAGNQRLALLHRGERAQLLARGAVLDEEGSNADASVSESKRAEFENTIDDYTEIVIQHGFIALFGMSCPLIALIALASSVVEFRLDCYKMLSIYQRPAAEYAVGIGEWSQILSAISTMSVMTMVGMATITSRSFHRLIPAVFGKAAGDHPIVSFLIFEHVLLFVRWLVGNMINEVPGSTYRLKVRREFLIAKFFDVGWKPHFRGARSGKHSAALV